MFEKYLNTDASKADPEQITKAYNLLKEYCDDSNINLVDFINNKDNIKPAAEYIHKELPFAVRMVLKKDKIEKLLIDNLDFIQAKAKELHDEETKQEKKATKTSKSKK